MCGVFDVCGMTYKRYVIKFSCSAGNMSDVMYAILMTRSKIHSVWHLGLEKYDRRVNSRNMVDVMVDIPEGKEGMFTDIAKVLLVVPKDYQGEMIIKHE